MCCTPNITTKNTTSKELNTLNKMFDEVVISQKEKYQLLTLRDKANKPNYDYVVWLELKVANGYSNGYSQTSGEILMQRVLKKLVLWVDKLKGFETTTSKTFDLFGDAKNEDEIEVLPPQPENGNWDKYFKECKRINVKNIMKKYTFLELFNPKFCLYAGIDHRLKLPTMEETRELYKKAILVGMKNSGRDNGWFWWDTPEYILVKDGLSDFELRDRLNSIRLFLVPYTDYFNCFIDDSLTDHSREDKTPEISYRYYLDGTRGLSQSGPHDIETLDFPSYDDIFNAELLEWVRETLNIPVLEVISDEDILKENLEHYFSSLLWYGKNEFDYKSRIDDAKDWKKFKAEITSFLKEKGIDANGGGSGVSLDGFSGGYALDKKGNIKITQLLEDRISLNRDIENLITDDWNSNKVVVFDISDDEIYRKAFELFKTKEVKTTSKITLENMMFQFATTVMKDYNSGDFYGGVKSTYIGYKDAKEEVISCNGAYQLFKIDDDYRSGKINGLAVSYSRDKDNHLLSFIVDEVYFGKAPFEKGKRVQQIGIKVMEMLLERSEYDVSKLSSLLVDYFNHKAISGINATIDYAQPIESKIMNTSCVQLSFDF